MLWKTHHLNTYFLLKTVIFHCHVSFQGGTPQKFNIDTQKWPYLKGVTRFQTIILGIHVIVFRDLFFFLIADPLFLPVRLILPFEAQQDELREERRRSSELHVRKTQANPVKVSWTCENLLWLIHVLVLVMFSLFVPILLVPLILLFILVVVAFP